MQSDIKGEKKNNYGRREVGRKEGKEGKYRWKKGRVA